MEQSDIYGRIESFDQSVRSLNRRLRAVERRLSITKGDIDLFLYDSLDGAPNNIVADSATKRDWEHILITDPHQGGYYFIKIALDPRDADRKTSYKLWISGDENLVSCPPN